VTAVPAAAVTAALAAWHAAGCAGQHEPDHFLRADRPEHFRIMLEAAAPLIAAAERDRIRHIINSRKQGLSPGDPYESGRLMACLALLQELSDSPRPVIINTPGGTT
jgi:hypothetical protein